MPTGGFFADESKVEFSDGARDDPDRLLSNGFDVVTVGPNTIALLRVTIDEVINLLLSKPVPPQVQHSERLGANGFTGHPRCGHFTLWAARPGPLPGL